MKIFILICVLLSQQCFSQTKTLIKDGKTAEKLTAPLINEQESEDFISAFFDSISFSVKENPVFIIPVAQTGKDLGITYGIMPIMAINSRKEENPIKFVMAPSFTINRYLKKTFSHRHYYFPNENTIILGRASFSQKIQKETIFWYYNSNFLTKKVKLGIQLLDCADTKYSFYGYGPDSKKDNRENYTFYSKGAEAILSFPVSKKIFLEYNSSFYSNSIGAGVIGDSFRLRYPQEYTEYSKTKQFFVNKFSVLLDTLDHPILPKIGNYFILSAAFSFKDISGYSFSSYSIESKKLYNYGDKKQFVTAVRYLLSWQTGERIPFYAQNRIGESSALRMAGEGRFTDKTKMAINLEQRITLKKSALMKFLSELEFTPFLDMATVAPSVSKLKLNDIKYGPGAAFRVILRPHIVAVVQTAFGSEGANAIVTVGYPF